MEICIIQIQKEKGFDTQQNRHLNTSYACIANNRGVNVDWKRTRVEKKRKEKMEEEEEEALLKQYYVIYCYYCRYYYVLEQIIRAMNTLWTFHNSSCSISKYCHSVFGSLFSSLSNLLTGWMCIYIVCSSLFDSFALVVLPIIKCKCIWRTLPRSRLWWNT